MTNDDHDSFSGLVETIEAAETAILNEIRDLAARLDRRFERLEQRLHDH